MITHASVDASQSTSQKYDLAVFIARMQPLHFGHLSVINKAFKVANNVLVLIGSANAPRSHRNPFTHEERTEMLYSCFQEKPLNLYTEALEDSAYNDTQWTLDVQRSVDFVLDDIAEGHGLLSSERKKMRVTLIGHSKDHTSYYLNMFPAYDSMPVDNYLNLSSTPMRNLYFSNICDMWLKNCDGHRPGDKTQEHLVPSGVREFLMKFAATKEYKEIRDEYEFIDAYKAKWASAPFPVTMITTDAVVIQSGHVLMIRRGQRPGRGTWALPGGYLGQNEAIIDGVVRELVEETKIAIPKDELKKLIVGSQVFDDPHRDARGRIITHAFRFDLPPRRTPTKITKKKIKLDVQLEPVEGSDDADFAKWIPLSELDRQTIFADHLDIIQTMLRLR